MADQELVDLFMSLFRGRTDVWGSVTGKSNKEIVTRLNYEAHLDGKVSLGIYPLLDDGECYFAAIDLDEKDFSKMLLIRNHLNDLGVKSYICQSKSKGFHQYLFADENGWTAKNVREMLARLLIKLNIQCEVFPKQDKLDEVIKYGNYINLCAFADTRQFLTADQQPVATEIALKLIQRNSQEMIDKATQVLPPIPSTMIPIVKPEKKDKTTSSKALKSPPCIEKLLKGVDAGMRDEAAFAIARHLLDQGDIPEEVLARLIIWDARNKPPIGDTHMLQEKVASAAKGYAFGCTSITQGLLSSFCIGEQNCQFLKNSVKEKKKEGLIVERSFYEDDNFIYEEVAKITRANEVKDARFIRFEKATGTVSEVKEIVTEDKTIWPVSSEEVGYRAVVLSTGVEDYGDTIKLVEEIKTHINKYTDLPENFREFTAWYVLMSWVYGRLPSMCYLRFLGDWGTGKSRSLDVIGGLCYKRMRLGGAVTTAPLFRMMKKYEGCLIIDEADFEKSDTTHEIVKILNSGIEKGTPIMRCTKDDPDTMQVFPCFGPKAFATRMRFNDDALESRCLTAVMEESDRDDIPSYLAKEFNETQRMLHRKLLLWRFRNMAKIPEEISEKTDIDLGHIEGRLKQVCIPFAMIFQDMPETLDRFRRFLQGYTRELREARMDSIQGRVVYAFFKAAAAMGKDRVTISAVTKVAVDDLKLDIKENTTSKILHGMKIVTERKRYQEPGGVSTRVRVVKWDDKLMVRLYRRYLNDLTPTPEEDSEEEKFLELLGFKMQLK
jgi:hypothetical protein